MPGPAGLPKAGELVARAVANESEPPESVGGAGRGIY
eukprot:COSAG02_NODE_239_length_27693_cov_31.385700_4_plen_37_part_00